MILMILANSFNTLILMLVFFSRIQMYLGDIIEFETKILHLLKV